MIDSKARNDASATSQAAGAVETPKAELRARLDGIRGLLLDLDGVLVLKGRMIPGSVDALAHLDDFGLPYVVLTNTSLFSRATMAAQLARAGVALPPDRIVSAVSATADYTRRRFAHRPLYVLASPDALREFEGQNLLDHDAAAEAALGRSASEAPAPAEPPVAAVVIGDAADEFTPAHLGTAFRLVRRGARLVAMHRNRWWLTPEGETLDAGAYVVGLEYATERKAFLVGKPTAAFFRAALRRLRELAGPDPRHLVSSDVLMVGDDLWQDVLAAQRMGLRGALVLTGRHGPAELARAVAGPHPRRPDAVAASLEALLAAID